MLCSCVFVWGWVGGWVFVGGVAGCVLRGLCAEQAREKLFWEVADHLQKAKKDQRRQLEEKLGDNKRSRTK